MKVTRPRCRRPVIGVPVPVETASWRVWHKQSHLLATSYASHLYQSGSIPVMLPVGSADPHDDADQLVQSLDGLMLAGGSDISPSLYGATPHPEAGPFDIDRDRWEAALVHAAVAAQIPILGICRGMQLINTSLGGTLQQHLPELVYSDVHNPSKDKFGIHSVETTRDTWLREALGTRLKVATYHHQSVDHVASGLVVSAFADDGIPEALEDLERHVIAVQWHPEEGCSNDLFRSFTRYCG